MSEGKKKLRKTGNSYGYEYNKYYKPKPILALIRTEGLSTDEAVVASSRATIHCKNKAWDKQRKEYIEWCGDYKTEPFQTTKDLKTLEKQFREAKITAVHLYTKQGLYCEYCKEFMYEHSIPANSHICQKTGENVRNPMIFKPLMLAVFAPEDIVRELV